MRVLGSHFGHEASACLVEKGRVIRHIAEERFNRIKNSMTCPVNSVKFVLSHYKESDIDKVAMPSGIVPTIKDDIEILFNKDKNREMMSVYLENSLYNFKSEIIDHHLCHAAAGYYTSGFEDSLIITMDGIGDKTSTAVWQGEKGKINNLYKISDYAIEYNGKTRKHDKFYSNGFFYGMATEALGWLVNEGEGKVMGLAPYGNDSKIPESIIRELAYKVKTLGVMKISGTSHLHFGGTYNFVDLINIYSREDVAAAVQKFFEKRCLRTIKYWLKKTGAKMLCLGGGCFMNVKLNQVIENECDCDVWVFPLASDGGLSVGAALTTYHNQNPYNPERISDIYWGDEFDNDHIERILKRNKLRYTLYDVSVVARYLEQNKIVARFDGKMESGARALGNRSILMSPLKAENKDIINRDVKFREAFRPFCPSVTAESFDRYFDGGGEFMITACNVKEKSIPAVTHVDGTARPQRVRKEINPKFHELLTKFGELTGHPVLLNTSFNIKGEPIIRTPDEAIRCFFDTGIDYLILGNYILGKGE